MATPVSKTLVSEMATVIREAGQAPAAPNHKKDDHVIAAALALIAWNDQVRTKLMAASLSYEQQMQDERDRLAMPAQQNTKGERMVRDYLKKIGVLQVKQDTVPKNTRIYIPPKAS
jgi:hypothetical protein